MIFEKLLDHLDVLRWFHLLTSLDVSEGLHIDVCDCFIRDLIGLAMMKQTINLSQKIFRVKSVKYGILGPKCKCFHYILGRWCLEPTYYYCVLQIEEGALLFLRQCSQLLVVGLILLFPGVESGEAYVYYNWRECLLFSLFDISLSYLIWLGYCIGSVRLTTIARCMTCCRWVSNLQSSIWV